MLSFLRGADPKRRNSSADNPIYYESASSWQKFSPPGSKYFTTHYIPSKTSFFNPPPHLHLYQDEEFRVVKGTGIWRQPTNEASKREAVKREGEPPIFLAKGRFHQFENPSETEGLEVEIALSPESNGAEVEEKFFRNFFGYLEDCRVQGASPSLFQLELFLHTVSTPLAIPILGPDWLKAWVSKAVMLVLGVAVGEYLLGYKRSYPEYSAEESQE
jgi:hypothetical protein